LNPAPVFTQFSFYLNLPTRMSLPPEKMDANGLKQTPRDRVRPARGWERVFPVFIQRTGEGRVHVMIHWRRLLMSLGVLMVAAWLSLALAAWVYVYSYRGVKAVTYWHLAFPWKWDDYRMLRGAHYIETAKELIETSQWRGAYLNLRVGLQKDPTHREGRLLLAKFYSMLRRFELAEETLVAGLAYHRNDDAYLQSALQFLLQLQSDARVIELATSILADPAAAGSCKRIAALYAATAHAYRGSYDRAEDLIFAYQLAETREGRMLAARIEWERGYPELALLKLEQLRAGLPRDDEVAGMLAGYYRESGRTDDARRLNVLRQVMNPAAPQPRIALLRLLAETGDNVAAAREVEDVMRDFSRDGATMTALAEHAANTGNTALVRRIYEHCKATDLPWDAPAVLMVESCIVAGRHQEALDLTRTLLRENPEWSRRHYTLFNGLQAIALHGLGDHDAARLFMKNFLGQATIRSEQLTATARRLAAVGAGDDARELLARAVQDDPLNQAALTQLIELDLAAGRMEEIPVSVRKLLTMRKPSPQLLAQVQAELGRDRWLFVENRTAALDELGAALAQVSTR
jgi:thioredoxin-like negative regulator of GroEL